MPPPYEWDEYGIVRRAAPRPFVEHGVNYDDIKRLHCISERCAETLKRSTSDAMHIECQYLGEPTANDGEHIEMPENWSRPHNWKTSLAFQWSIHFGSGVQTEIVIATFRADCCLRRVGNTEIIL